MFGFRQFLLEVIRDEDRASKLGTYLTARHAKYHKPDMLQKLFHDKLFGDRPERKRTDKIYLNKFSRIDVMRATHAYEKAKLLYPHIKPIRTVLPIDKIIVTQPSTTFKAEKAFKNTTPVAVIKHKDQHFIVDGHHRLIDHKLTGKKLINADVYDLDKE